MGMRVPADRYRKNILSTTYIRFDINGREEKIIY